MNLPIKLRRHLVRLALLSATSFAVGLCLPSYSAASQTATRSEERAARNEERSARREDERAIRSQEREAARNAHGEPGSGNAANEPGSNEAPSETGTSPAAPATAPSERGCQVGIEASSTRIVAGEVVTLSGTLECPRSTSAADQQVPIYERQGAGSFSILGNATTKADGTYKMISAVLSANTVFQVHEGNHRARVAVKVAPGITLTVVSPVSPAAQASTAGAPVRAQTRTRTTFSGTVTPAVTGALVALQIAYQASGERWHSIAYGHVAADGSYAIAHTFRTPGAVSVRALVHLGRHYAPAISEPLSYEVPQPQNPQLSIATSTDPLISGQPLTISGVAAGAASQPVSLLAQTSGGAFTEVAKGVTNASGEYTFTEAPLQNTYYRVTDAATQSATLFEGVELALTPTPAPAPVPSGQQLTFSGTLAPAPVGQTVYLEAEYASGVRFHVIASGTVEAGFQYVIAHTFASAGTAVLRISAADDGAHVPSTSAPFTITVSG